jgi:hypothetical protein
LQTSAPLQRHRAGGSAPPADDSLYIANEAGKLSVLSMSTRTVTNSGAVQAVNLGGLP